RVCCEERPNQWVVAMSCNAPRPSPTWHKLSNVPHVKPRATPLAMSDNPSSVDVSLGRQGRLVIPASLRRSLDLEEGDRLVARQEANRLVIEKPEQIKQRLKARFAQVPAERRLVDELIAERREESRREGEG
ncbi:MAG: AbrB/MazE/SpoVT family DNA-binding domain-containing protein, partial [Vulcanococcus sp.]